MSLYCTGGTSAHHDTSRKCPGVHFVTDTITILAASLLHVFNIGAGMDADGNPYQLGTDIIDGLVPYVIVFSSLHLLLTRLRKGPRRMCPAV